METKQKGSQIFVDIIKSFGIEYLFSVPGTTLLDIYDVLREETSLHLIIARHEQAATMMADGYARISGKPGIVLVSRAPALCNTVMGLYGAYTESSPVIVVNGSPALNISYRDCFEEIDVAALVKPVSKWYTRIDVASRIEELMVRAIRESITGRPRPVVVSFPIDIQRSEISHYTETAKMPTQIRCSPARLLSSTLKSIKSLLEISQKPLLLLGGGCHSIEELDVLVRVAEILHIPVVATWGRPDVFPNSHPLYAGMAGPGAFNTTKKILKLADTILAVGCRFSEFTTNRYTCFSNDMRLIHVDIDTSEIGKIFPPEIGAQSDSSSFFQDFLGLLFKDPITQKTKTWAEDVSKEFNDEKQGTKITSASHPRMKYVEIFKKHVPKNSIFTIDCATFGPWLTRYYEFEQPKSVMISAAGCLGFGFPAGMGAALAATNRKSVSVVGDGSFLMCLPNLATAVQEKIPLVVVVMNNSCYGNIAERQNAFFEGKNFGCDLINPDFAEVAKAFGALGFRAENPDEFDIALEKAMKSNKPCVIDNIEKFGYGGLPAGSKPLVAK